jgi:hypothetical protein
VRIAVGQPLHLDGHLPVIVEADQHRLQRLRHRVGTQVLDHALDHRVARVERMQPVLEAFG